MPRTLADLIGTHSPVFRVGKAPTRAVFDASGLTAPRTLTVQDAAGTLALTADVAAAQAAAIAYAVQRANHTGTQLAATISDFTSAAVAAGSGVWQPLSANLTGLASDYTAATKALMCNHTDAATSAGLHIGNSAHQDVAMFGAGGSQGTTLYGQLNCLAIDSTSASGVLTRAAATQDAVRLLGRAGGTSSRTLTLTTAALGADRTATFPDAVITVAGQNIDNAFSTAQTFAGSVPSTPTSGQVLIGGGAVKAGGAISCSLATGTAITLGSGSGASSTIASSLGNLIRHQRYGYSTAYTAVQIGDASRGVGFGIDPNTIAGGQFRGDNRDFFMRRGSAFGCPNAGDTDWEWALGISGGSGVAGQPVVKIDTVGMAIGAGSGTILASERLRVAGGTMGTPGATDVLVAAGAISCGAGGTFAGTVIVPNGTAAAPGIRLTSEASGLYYNASGSLGVSVKGVATARFRSPSTSQWGGWLMLENPAADQPSWFSGNLDTSFIVIGGTSVSGINSGGQARLYGSTHATKPNYVEFTRGTTVSAYFNGSGILTLNNTTDASAIGTAAMVGLGGASIAKSLWVGGTAGNYINIANATGELRVNGTKVLGAQGAAVADATGAGDVVAQLNALLARCRAHGLIAT